MGQSYKNAERLIRTEASHFHNTADRTAYEAAGVEEYEFMATLDNRTSETCGSLDGQHFKLKDAVEGVNYPPMHPNCRSTTIEYDPEDADDWAAVGKEMPENMTYSEWKAKQDAEHGEGYVDKERKKEYNKAKDSEQYENYKERLGADAPKNLDDFQNLKYGDSETEYNDLKELYSYKGRVPEAKKRRL